MGLKKLVSVIIPLFNQKLYIVNAIESVLAQTYPEIEIIVVDDGSTDHPGDVLTPYQDQILLIQQKNAGSAAARNAGLRKATGEYIQFLDADDWLHPQKIRLQVEDLETRQGQASYCEIMQFFESSGQKQIHYVGEVDDMFTDLYNLWQRYPLLIHSLLVKKTILQEFGGFNEVLYANVDRYLFCNLAAHNIKFLYFPFIGGWRRIHDRNITRPRLAMFTATGHFYQQLHQQLGSQFFLQKFGYSADQMMCANLTYLYGTYLTQGVSLSELSQIKKWFRTQNLRFEAQPIPMRFTRHKLGFFFLLSFARRWKNMLF